MLGWLLLVVALITFALQLDAGWRALHNTGPLTAMLAKSEVEVFAAACAAVAAGALLLPGRARWLVVIGPATVLFGVLAATAVLGAHIEAMVASVLVYSSLWWVGRELLTRIGAGALARQPVVAWLAGLGPLCLLSVGVGRLGIFRWWTLGLVVVVTGMLGLAAAGRALWRRRATIAADVIGTPLAAAATGVLSLTVAAAAIFTSAPEIQYDPLYGKAYLPMLWARTGTIGPLNQHVQLNITGWGQLMASWGNLLGAPATGRYLQLLALVAVPIVVWVWARRFSWLGPAAAVAVGVTPTLFWQATTADDDLLLALAMFALTVAVFQALQPHFAAGDRAAGMAIGLLAGTAVSLKSHLIPIALVLLAGWVVAGGRGRLRDRCAFAALGLLITGGPPLALRWIDTGNPVFPAYNNVFHSPYWLPINETLNFPFWPGAGIGGALEVVWKAMVDPLVMQEAAPPGLMGVLMVVVALAVLAGWAYRRRMAGTLVIWTALVLAALAWWIELRYLRYLLPTAFASVVLLLAVLRPAAPGRALTIGLTAGAALLTAASFAVSVAMFWNVPNHRVPISAAIGRWSADSYLSTALGERQAVEAFNRLAPPRAIMISSAFERVWLTQGRDLYPSWELDDLMRIHGSDPTTGAQAYAQMSARRIRWALVSAGERIVSGPSWVAKLLASHGQPRYSGQEWDLYQLVDRPTAPRPEAACDRAGTSVPSCWTGARRPGGVPAGPVVRQIPVCPGQELAVDVTERAGGPDAAVLIQFPGAGPLSAAMSGQGVPGAMQPTYATVPGGANQAVLTINPAGAQVTGAAVKVYGPPCSSS